MSLERYTNRRFLSSRIVSRFLPGCAAFLFVVASYMTFFVAPVERVMGDVQRIFYFHVASAISCYLTIAIVFCSSVLFLLSRKHSWDQVQEAAVSVSFALCSIVLFSGMIWGHSAWNIWWRWEPRLVSFLVLWLILLSNVFLRRIFVGDNRLELFTAVLGLLSAINVPIVVFSIKLLAPTEQLHPQVIANQGLQNPWMIRTLLVATLAMIVVSLVLFLSKLLNCVIRDEKKRASRSTGA